MRYNVTVRAVGATVALSLVFTGCSSVPLTQPAKPSVQSPAQTASPPIGANTGPVGGLCNNQLAQWAVGKKSTLQVVEQARVRAGARMARVLHPKKAVTLELNAQRLNLHVDSEGKIISVDCG